MVLAASLVVGVAGVLILARSYDASPCTVICALVTDLMDRSKITNAIPGVQFTVAPDADVVIVDLSRNVDLADIRAQAPNAKVVGYGPHVDDFSGAGADVVLPRSKFFADPAAHAVG